MMEALRISVIIPTYNRAAQVPVAVRSVLEQTSPPHEVIVIDDGSTDATGDALAPFMDRIRYIRIGNGGVSAARNRGIHEATGNWIAFLDSDDTWRAEKLRRQTDCIMRTGAKVCFCTCADESGDSLDGLCRMDSALDWKADKFYPPGDFRIFKQKGNGHPILLSMIVEKSALMKSGVFDESLRVAEDHKLMHGLVIGYGYAFVNETLVDICRKRDFSGLSDPINPEVALMNCQCCGRVHSETSWRLLPLDADAAANSRRKMLYFISRCSELACALRNKPLAKRYALAGLSATAGWKIFVRNLLILGAYPVAEKIFTRKWKT
jgi:glycosyltransferase involved in cell wall biosynthesis